MINFPRSGDRFLGIGPGLDGIIWELIEEPVGSKCMAVLVVAGSHGRTVGEKCLIVNGVWTSTDRWQYLGNFGKTHKFNSLYDKLSS